MIKDPRETTRSVKEMFLEDVENHTVEPGVFVLPTSRSMTLSNNRSSNHRYTLTFIPHYLIVTGDMGSWVFHHASEPDLRPFFRRNDLEIKSHEFDYWYRKLEAEDRNTKAVEYCPQSAEAIFRSHYGEYLEDQFEEDSKGWPDYRKKKFLEGGEVLKPYDVDTCWARVEDRIEAPHVWAFRKAIEGFQESVKIYWDLDLELDMIEEDPLKFTHHFQWILYAIVWGLQKYDGVV